MFLLNNFLKSAAIKKKNGTNIFRKFENMIFTIFYFVFTLH